MSCGPEAREYTVVAKPALTSTIAPSSPTGPAPSTTARRPCAGATPGWGGVTHGSRCCTCQTWVIAFSAMVRGSVSTPTSRSVRGTGFM